MSVGSSAEWPADLGKPDGENDVTAGQIAGGSWTCRNYCLYDSTQPAYIQFVFYSIFLSPISKSNKIKAIDMILIKFSIRITIRAQQQDVIFPFALFVWGRHRPCDLPHPPSHRTLEPQARTSLAPSGAFWCLNDPLALVRIRSPLVLLY